MKVSNKLLSVYVMGGSLVLLSYSWGFIYYNGIISQVWGGIEGPFQGISAFFMVFATIGFFMFAPYFVFHPLDTNVNKLLERLLLWCHYSFFIGSILWMPMTIMLITTGDIFFWVVVCGALWIVAAASLGLVIVCYFYPERDHMIWKKLAFVGTFLLACQTVVLDAVIWVSRYPLSG